MSDTVTRFLGGSPGRIAIQLIAISFIVGIILSVLGVSPYDILNGLERLLSRIYNMGFDTVEWIFRYFLLGAVVVIPIWLIMRVLKIGRGTSVGPELRSAGRHSAASIVRGRVRTGGRVARRRATVRVDRPPRRTRRD